MTRFASLTAGLLARKGEAEPASTPFADQLFTRVGATGPDMNYPSAHRNENLATRTTAKAAFRFSGPFAVEPCLPRTDVVMPPATVIEEDVPEMRCAPCAASPGEDQAKTFHVNLRLKRPRFVKLKLSAALLRRPAQDIVSEALDHWFEKLPHDVLGDCACMRGGSD